MARYKGIFKASANYEPQVAAPFDARMLVEAKADLTAAETWQQGNGASWAYAGMMVAVAADQNAKNNGVYLLLANDYSVEANWRKCADIADIENLQDQINNLEISGGGSLDVEVDSESELPETGDENTTYYVKNDKSIQRWDEETQDYISYGGAPAMDINIIHGGNAHGTN